MEENNRNSRKKSNNNFFLIAFLISIFTIVLTWTSLAKTKVGITDVLPCIYQTAAKVLKGQGLSIFAFAFFLYAILQSQAFQALFASKRKWLEKRKYFTIGLITIGAALLSSNLSWFDEFVHFYPLVIPLFLAMGFDVFSSILCLYGGSIAGLIGLVSAERMKSHFSQSFSSTGESINYNGLAGISFRFVSFALIVSIVVLFNIWYCSRNKQKPSSKKGSDVTEKEIAPKFDRTKKIILAVAGVFLLTSILAQFTPIATKLKENKITEKIPAQISNEYDKEEGKYKEVGNIGKMKMAKAKTNKEGYWGTFGNWEERALDCWFIVGGIIICLLAQQSIMGNFVSAIQNSIPLLLIYIFAAVPATILQSSGVSDNLAKAILPASKMANAKFLALFSIFGLSILLGFFICTSTITTALVGALAPTLLSISESTLIYAAIFAWVGAIVGMAFSPNNGILIASLEKGKKTYKQFLKKTWLLGLTIIMTMFSLVAFWIGFVVK